MVEDGAFDLSDVAIEARFLRGIGFPVPVSGLAPAGSGTSFLLHLGFVPHGDVLDIDAFFVIMLRRLPSCSC